MCRKSQSHVSKVTREAKWLAKFFWTRTAASAIVALEMATIRPFIAQRFADSAGSLENLIAPPYDVISPEQRQELAARSVYNTVWLTLPEQLPEDRSKFVKYARSATRLAEWRREGILVADEKPGIYRLRQTFTDPITGALRTREALICLLKIEPYESGIVLPHEQTFPKHKEDRLRLLEATRSHLECIFGLYRDEMGKVAKALRDARFVEAAKVGTQDGVMHELSRCSDEQACKAMQEAMAEEKIWIADGHHRYETAAAYREAFGKGKGEVAEDFILIGLSAMSDPGLTLLPTHRLVKSAKTGIEEMKRKLAETFTLREMPNRELPSAIRSEAKACRRAFGIVLGGGQGLLATLDSAYDGQAANMPVTEGQTEEGERLLKSLDVTIIHDVILKEGFGITGTEGIEYTRDEGEAISGVEKGVYLAAILTNPPSVQDMRRIAECGKKMPQKSTYYYPKLPSGLVFWSLADFV